MLPYIFMKVGLQATLLMSLQNHPQIMIYCKRPPPQERFSRSSINAFIYLHFFVCFSAAVLTASVFMLHEQ